MNKISKEGKGAAIKDELLLQEKKNNGEVWFEGCLNHTESEITWSYLLIYSKVVWPNLWCELILVVVNNISKQGERMLQIRFS